MALPIEGFLPILLGIVLAAMTLLVMGLRAIQRQLVHRSEELQRLKVLVGEIEARAATLQAEVFETFEAIEKHVQTLGIPKTALGGSKEEKTSGLYSVTYLPVGKVVSTSEEGISLFLLGQASNIEIPTACGGEGNCGLCRVEILDGMGHISALNATEERWLGADRKPNLRLSCQCRIRGDIKLLIPKPL